MNECNVCGTCQYYDEYANGYCSKLTAIVEPEEYSCKEYELNKDGLEE